jgi:chromosome segregation ATPase
VDHPSSPEIAADLPDPNLSEAERAELRDLQQQLELRDQLVDQLSTQLFQMVQAHPPALPSAGQTSSRNRDDGAELVNLTREMEQQIEFYQGQIDQRDAEISKLQHSCQELSDRNQMLEHVIQDMPEVYRQQFAARLDQLKTKMQALQEENKRLYTELAHYNPEAARKAAASKRLMPSRRSK